MRFLFPVAAALVIFVAPTSAMPECPQGLENLSVNFKRQYIAMYNGLTSIGGNETSFSRNLGTCRSTEEHAAKMFEHFRAFGIDLSPLMENPFQYYENDQFMVRANVAHPGENLRVILKSQEGYASVANAPIKNAVWILSAKSDLNGQGGLLPAGHLSYYGIIRFKDDGKDFCLIYTERSPIPASSSATITREFIIEHESLGVGTMRGVLSYKDGIANGPFVFTL